MGGRLTSIFRKMPWIVRVLIISVVTPFAFFFFGVCDLVNWLARRVRR